MREIFIKILSTSGAKVYGMLVSSISLILTARWLGPEGRGTLVASSAWLTTFTMIGYLSLGQVMLHKASLFPNKSWLPGAIGTLGISTGIISLSGWLIAFFLFSSSNGSFFNNIPHSYLVICLLILPFSIWEQYVGYILMAIGKYEFQNRSQVIGRTIGLLLLGCSYITNGGANEALISIIIGQVISSWGGFFYLMRQIEWRPVFDLKLLKFLISGSMRLHPAGIGIFLTSTSGILVINQLLTPTETGIYQLAMQLITIVSIFPQSAAQILYGPMIPSGSENAWIILKKPLVTIISITIIICIFSAILAPWLLPLITGNKFLSSIQLFQIGLIAVVLLSFTSLMGNIWIIKGWFWQLSTINLLSGICTIFLNYLLIPSFGGLGAIYSFIAGIVIFSIANIILVFKLEMAKFH